jgi:hypothetical protein
MTATLIREHGGPEQLLVETVARPRPGAGEALVRVAACALNHLDIFVRRGTPGIAVQLPPHRRGRYRRLGAGARSVHRHPNTWWQARSMARTMLLATATGVFTW